MGFMRTLTGAATGLVGAAIAVESAPLLITGMVGGAIVNNLIGSSNDDNIRQKEREAGFKDGYHKAKEEDCNKAIECAAKYRYGKR